MLNIHQHLFAWFSDTVENTEYFNLPDDSGTPPSSDYQVNSVLRVNW